MSMVILNINNIDLGTIMIRKVGEDKDGIKYSYKRQISEMKSKTVRPLWLLFPGLGGQWTAMAKALMPIDIFSNKVEECHQIMTEFGIDLKNQLLSEDKSAMDNIVAKYCATTAIEIALFEVLENTGHNSRRNHWSFVRRDCVRLCRRMSHYERGYDLYIFAITSR